MDQRTPSSELKANLRTEAFAARREARSKHGSAASDAILARGLTLPSLSQPVRTVSGYYPIRDEIGPLPLLSALHARGLTIALPVTRPGPALIFRVWVPGSPLDHAHFGLREPADDCPEISPELLFVPLLGFDLSGNRLGYGAGYFDAGLRRLRGEQTVTAIGLAFDEQEFPSIPHEPQDERLDMIVTPSRVIWCGA